MAMKTADPHATPAGEKNLALGNGWLNEVYIYLMKEHSY
jgi:hypothetical protein